MKGNAFCATLCVALVNSTVWAQAPVAAPAASETAPPPALVAQPVATVPALELPANTELMLSMNEEISSKKVEEGHIISR